MTATLVEGRSFFYVLNENAYNNSYHGKHQDKNFIVAHLHHLLITRMKEVTAYVVWITPEDIIPCKTKVRRISFAII